MNLRPIIARLEDECPTLKLVGGAAQYERAVQALAAYPAAFVMPAEDRAERSPFMSQTVEQRVASIFVVMLAVRNLADGEGAAAVEALEPVRIAVRDALLAWQPDYPINDMDGCEYEGGAIVAFHNGFLWWGERYLTAYTIRST